MRYMFVILLVSVVIIPVIFWMFFVIRYLKKIFEELKVLNRGISSIGYRLDGPIDK